MKKVDRNAPCPCGSSKKYKQCCGSLGEVQAEMAHTVFTSPSNSFQAALEYHQAGRLLQAEAIYRQILQREPNHPEALHFLGVIAYQTGNNDIAVELISKAIGINASSQMYCNLGAVFQALYKLDNAVESYRNALALKPDFADAYHNLGITLLDQGNLEAAVENFRQALVLKPDYAEAYSKLLFLYGYHASLESREYLAIARSWELACVPAQDRKLAHDRTFNRPPSAGRRLRVGYISCDYRHHPVSFNIEQIFAHHDRTRIELFAYSTNGVRDAVTERLQALVEHWVPVMGLPDAAIRERIEADGIDVLIDLSGHTAHNRMGVFARRAAPVQAYYLGYFASTGLTEMDYLIGDDILTPPETDSHFSEQVWRLPRIWQSYNGKSDAPLTDWHPAEDGRIWVGSFNNLSKLTPATLSIWAKVLHALPEGRLLLKTNSLVDVGNRQRILNAMSGHGIAPDRIELRDSSDTPAWLSHMAYYNRLDIALDPVGGMGGGITTCDALWMGAPVITLEGDRYASRVTATILNAIGHPEWIARSEAEYIGKVVALARDVEHRKELRVAQRSRITQSPLCDASGLTRCIENAYFEMFDQWLGRQKEMHSMAL